MPAHPFRPARSCPTPARRHHTRRSRHARLAAPWLAGVLGLTVLSACGSDPIPTRSASGAAAAAPGAAAGHHDLSLADGWVKSSTGAMTGAFGTLVNNTGQRVRVVAATTPAAARVELHETRRDAGGQMVMAQAEDGFTIAPGGSLELRPGGNHLMLMKVTRPLEHGSSTAVTLEAEDGRRWSFELAVRDFAGANETYAPSADH